MTRSRSTVLARLAVMVVAVGLATSVLPATSASAATTRIKASFFGMTDHDPTSWPTQPVGAVRLWDTGVTWRDVETSNGVFDFSRLDAQVASARSHNARVLVVLGQTPRFHTSRPNAASYIAPGASSAPSLTAWKAYVTKVVRRYKGRGVDYQIWNEANVKGFWSGSTAQMTELTKTAAKIIRGNDSGATVVAPAMATRLIGQRMGIRDFYSRRTGGFPMSHWVDVVSLQLYPGPKERPEHSMDLLKAARSVLTSEGVHKPIWNTEINYGLQIGGGGQAAKIATRRQAAYVARTYVLNAANGVKKVFWYAWDLQSLANTKLTYASGSLTPAGTTYGVVRSWLLGSKVSSCSKDRRGTYHCVAKYSDGVRHIYWNPTKSVSIRTPATTTNWVSQSGVSTKIGSNKSLSVDYAPKMVRSRR
jgi:Glycosyl hydrolase catalytic core